VIRTNRRRVVIFVRDYLLDVASVTAPGYRRQLAELRESNVATLCAAPFARGVRRCAHRQHASQIALMKENPMTVTDDAVVQVRRGWNAWRTAEVRLGDLEDVHWHQPAGAPRAIVHAFVASNTIAGNDLRLTRTRERVLVCVLKSCTPDSVYTELARRADAPYIIGAA
jgi:hypothetical protein